MNAVRLGRALTLIGYFGLLVLVILWNGWIAPPTTMPRAVAIALLATPLLFPLRGLLHGRRYTHAWTSFLALGYFVLGVGVTYAEPQERGLGALEIAFSAMLYVGCIVYARASAAAARAGTPC